MRTIHRALLAVILFSFASSVDATNAKQGPHGGDIIEDGHYRFEVKVEPKSSTASVYVLRGKTRLSGEKMELTLLRDYDSGQTVGLKAMNLRDDLPHYQGKVSPNMGSYMGLQLSFSTNNNARKVLRTIPKSLDKDRR
jgi:hypothetical protein